MEEAVQYAVSSPPPPPPPLPPNINNNNLNHLSPSPSPHHHIVKGKRTKRMRPSSPLPLFNLSTTMEEVEGGGEGGGINTTTTTANTGINEEDEEMANCLILLSQGNPIINEFVKFSSKRYIETPISSNGKAGMYVYECKTCARTFPSFQALGGHRASHKKPKNMAAIEAMPLSAFAFSDDDDNQASPFMVVKNYKTKKPPAISLELNNWGSIPDFANKSPHQSKKFHECSYCGAQFTSGQALGGHMRRHRGVVPATPSTNTTLSLSPFPISPASINQQDSSDLQDEEGKKRKSNEISLDLNLPAPHEDRDHHHIKQQKPEPQNKPEPEHTLVLSTGRFIECRH